MKNTIDDLRNRLFATIEALIDPENPMSLDQAKAINQTAQTLINSAKVEVDYLEATGQEVGGDFFNWKDKRPPVLAANNAKGQGLVPQLLPRNVRGSRS